MRYGAVLLLADGLMAVRYKAETTWSRKCVTLIARAYRIVSVRARMPECPTAALVAEPPKPTPPIKTGPLGGPWPK